MLGWSPGPSASVGALFISASGRRVTAGWHNAVIGFHLLAQRSAAFERIDPRTASPGAGVRRGFL